MTKHTFTAAERFGVYRAHDGECFWCCEPIDFQHVTVDHLVPESADAATLAKAIADYGLPAGFALNSFENWVPAHSSCNSKKSATLYPTSPATIRMFAESCKKAPIAKKHCDFINNQPKRARALAKIEAAVDAGTITVEDLRDLLEDANAKKVAELLIANQWVKVSHNGSTEVVTDGTKVGVRPIGDDCHPSWTCSNCGRNGPWSGARCLSCGMLSDD